MTSIFTVLFNFFEQIVCLKLLNCTKYFGTFKQYYQIKKKIVHDLLASNFIVFLCQKFFWKQND